MVDPQAGPIFKPGLISRLAFFRRFDGHDTGAFSQLRADLSRQLADNTVVRRNQGMFHLHGFDHGQPVALGDGLAGLDQNGEQLAVHRRADDAITFGMICVRSFEIFQRHQRLPSVTQHIDG